MSLNKEQIIDIYLLNSPKVLAEMLYNTIERYENKKCINCIFICDNLENTGWCEYYDSENKIKSPVDYINNITTFGCTLWKEKK